MVVEELRRRLGSSFVVDELADLVRQRHRLGARELARRHAAGTDAASVVDAAFARYLREAKDFAGGRPRETHEKPSRTQRRCGEGSRSRRPRSPSWTSELAGLALERERRCSVTLIVIAASRTLSRLAQLDLGSPRTAGHQKQELGEL